jgi:hypothetical protein
MYYPKKLNINLILLILMLLVVLIGSNLKAQTLTQTVRGTVTDKISETPLPGAAVVLVGSNPLVGTTTDVDGNFKLTNVPVGKQSIKVTYIGYKEMVVPNITVNSGKELVIKVTLEENVIQGKEVVITDKADKNKPLNDLSVVSVRTFSVEETQKYAAAVNDPSRMVTSFTGILSTDDGNNQISIRGNSPNGLLYRMEGVEIPNPNHFSNVGTVGGGVSILSSQLLTNSDFSTGAFASEYGNVLSGVFDLRLRKGNNERHEYTFQIGVLGIDAAAEGPFKKGYGGSYLINYRYSTLGVLSKIGVNIGDAVTTFQDLSFNLSFPTKKAGNFTLFGFGGLSKQTTEAKRDTSLWDDIFLRKNSLFYANTGAVGITHTLPLNDKAYLKTVLVGSGTGNGYKEETLSSDFNPYQTYNEKFGQTKYTLSSALTYKFNTHHSIRTGVILNQLFYGLNQKYLDDSTNLFITQLNSKGNTQTLQAFGQWNYRITDKLTLNTGLHFLLLTLNNSYSVEPRASLKYAIDPRQSVTFGYGLHSQVQPIGVYFADFELPNGTRYRPNEKLGLSKAQHLVIGYDRMLTENLHIKVEGYYQNLYNIPISSNPNSTFSIINNQYGFVIDTLVNKGKGRNMGAEITFEQFLNKGFYFLLSTSVYNSTYKTQDNVWRNTRYNGNYNVAFTSGKEWTLSEKRKGRVIGINIKALYAGVMRNTPINVAESVNRGEPVYYEDQAYTQKNKDYYRIDVRFSLKRNYKKLTSTVALDIQNVTNRQNIGGTYFDIGKGVVKTWYQTPLIPILSYRLEF